MLEIKEYVKAESLEQAFELNQKRTNQIIGGMLWMKMGDHRIQTAIDLSGLGLDTIEEDETQFSIGCMTSLRQLELHEGLNQWSDGAVRESVRHIVGVQFRNLATVGGSIFGRFGFSDVLTCFLPALSEDSPDALCSDCLLLSSERFPQSPAALLYGSVHPVL